MHADLTDRVALVTGGGRGLGREIALAYAHNGADVVIASRDAEHCLEVAAKLTAETGRRVLGLGCHVGRWADCDALVHTAYQRFGRVDILVNNAGMSPLYPSLPEITEELFDKVLAVNLKGAFRLASLIGARMAQHSGGSIINISSIAAVQPRPTEVPYAAAKAGLNTLGPALPRLRPHRTGQHDHGRTVPHRHREVLGRRGVRRPSTRRHTTAARWPAARNRGGRALSGQRRG
jgi:NAD(P)-dependent dehydrogenase (short-subunit alcohol dehydrogenase family)